MISTSLYMPRDKLALTLNDSKDYPDRTRLIKFIRHVTGKSERSAASLIEQVIVGAHAAIRQAKRHARRGIARLEQRNAT